MSHKPSAIDAIANEYTAKVIELSPMTGSSTGLGQRHDVLDDFSPEGLNAYTQLDRETLAKLDEVAPTDAVDEVTVAAMRERLGLSIELAEAGEPLRNLNNIASTSQDIRDLFDLLPTETEQDWANISARLGDVKRALGGHVESLRLAASRGQVAAARQVRAVAGQAHNQAGESSSFLTLVSSPRLRPCPSPYARSWPPTPPVPRQPTATSRTSWRPSCYPRRASRTASGVNATSCSRANS